MFTQIANARMRSIDRGRQEQEAEEQKAQRQIQQAALLAGLQGSGVVDASAVDPNAEAGRYTPLGQTGRVLDNTQTPDCRAKAAKIVADRQAQTEQSRLLAGARARY